VQELHAALRGKAREALRELVRVARLVARRHASAFQHSTGRSERGFDGHALSGLQHLDIAAVLAHYARGPERRIELGFGDAQADIGIMY
jgi:hypothetical protein